MNIEHPAEVRPVFIWTCPCGASANRTFADAAKAGVDRDAHIFAGLHFKL